MPEEMRESPRGRSMLSLYQQCQMKWSWKYLKGYKLIEEADHLTFGSAVHESQAEFYINNFSYPAMMGKACDFLAERNREDLLSKVKAALDLWFHKIGDLDTDRADILEVEEEAHLILPNGFDMTVRRDRVLQYKDSGEIFINDTKTTGWSLMSTIKNYMYSDQPQLYIASAIQEKPEWRDKLSGWRTDCIYIPKNGTQLNRWGATKDAVRSDISSFTDDRIDATVKSYAVQTSDMAYKVQAVEDGEDISSQFSMCNSNCLAFNRVCEYYNFCHEIDTIGLPPAQFKVDEWLESGAVLDGFRGLKE